jgi:hypothetical protein
LVRTMPALALLPPSCLQLGELDATSHSHTQRQHMLTVTYGLKGCPLLRSPSSLLQAHVFAQCCCTLGVALLTSTVCAALTAVQIL